jgi:nitroreductase/NAD-dependent dihydropyrimidine dehydrogenase PreA subunit
MTRRIYMDLFEVNHETCNQDGICAAVCPSGLIDFKEGDYPKPVPEAEEICIRCGHCVAVCPTGSLTHRVMSVDQCPQIKKEQIISSEQCEQFLKGRRSIRVYRDKGVPRDVLERLIDIARCAPTGHNSQGVGWMVLGNREELRCFSGITVEWMRWLIDNMPELAGPMHLDRAIERWEKGVDIILRDAPVVIVAHAQKGDRLAPANCTIALAYLELAAAGMDLGCCWAGFFAGAAVTFPAMTEALPVPDGHQCYGAMMVGYPKFSYPRIPRRKAPKVTWRM